MEATWHDLAAGAGALAHGPAGQPENPLVLLDLDRLGPPPPGLRPAPGPGAVVVGVTSSTPPAAALEYLTCWVAQEEVAAVAATVATAPVAALVLADLLRSRIPDAGAALRAESLAYSTLLAGGEFRCWLAANRVTPADRDGDPVLLSRSGEELTITLNRPARHNAYDAAMRDGLRDALAVALADPAVWVVLRGAGPSFCSGGDLAEFGAAADPALAHLIRLSAGAAARMRRLGARTRAEVQGACIGAGIELAAFAGRIEADRGAWFQLPELGMGLVPGAGGTVSIPARVGRWRTAQLALTRRRLDAATALSWGLIDAISG